MTVAPATGGLGRGDGDGDGRVTTAVLSERGVASESAAIEAASTPAPPGATTRTARDGAAGGAKATTRPSARPPGMGAVPVLASAAIDRDPNAPADPYSADPRMPSRTIRRATSLIATGGSGPTPTTRATAARSARGAVNGPARPRTADAQGASSGTGVSPAFRRTSFNVARGNRAASCTKKSLQEYASASAAESGRFRLGCEHAKRRPSAVATRRHMYVVCSSTRPASTAAASAKTLATDPGSTGVSSTSGKDSLARRPLGHSRSNVAAPGPLAGGACAATAMRPRTTATSVTLATRMGVPDRASPVVTAASCSLACSDTGSTCRLRCCSRRPALRLPRCAWRRGSRSSCRRPPHSSSARTSD